MEEFGSLREIGISLSCPEACRIILRDSKKVTFELSENDEEVNRYNDINAMLYIELMQCRKIVIDILQNRSIDLNTRASIVLNFTKEIQDKIDENEIISIKAIREKYLKEDYIREIIDSLEEYKDDILIEFGDKPTILYRVKDKKKEDVLSTFKEMLDKLIALNN